MLSLNLSAFNRKTKVKLILILSAFVLTALVAVSLCCFCANTEDNSGYRFELEETGGVGGFLSQFGLEYERQESKRELTFPEKTDEIFADYSDLQSELGISVLKLSGKRVEERYLKLRNKTEKGQQLYAVVYVYKKRVVAAHLTTLEQDAELLPITAFV